MSLATRIRTQLVKEGLSRHVDVFDPARLLPVRGRMHPDGHDMPDTAGVYLVRGYPRTVQGNSLTGFITAHLKSADADGSELYDDPEFTYHDVRELPPLDWVWERRLTAHDEPLPWMSLDDLVEPWEVDALVIERLEAEIDGINTVIDADGTVIGRLHARIATLANLARVGEAAVRFAGALDAYHGVETAERLGLVKPEPDPNHASRVTRHDPEPTAQEPADGA